MVCLISYPMGILFREIYKDILLSTPTLRQSSKNVSKEESQGIFIGEKKAIAGLCGEQVALEGGEKGGDYDNIRLFTSLSSR